MEFIRVTFPTTRGVNVDGAPQGTTGQVIRVQAGLHRFDLGTPLDYTPPTQRLPVSGTTRSTPLPIAFVPVVLDVLAIEGVPPLPPLPPAPPAPAAKRARSAAKHAKPGKRATPKKKARVAKPATPAKGRSKRAPKAARTRKRQTRGR